MGSRKIVAISAENYEKVKRFGLAGESMNQAIGKLLQKAAGGSD